MSDKFDLCSICQHRQKSRESCEEYKRFTGGQSPSHTSLYHTDPAPLTICRHHDGYVAGHRQQLNNATRSECPLFVEVQH